MLKLQTLCPGEGSAGSGEVAAVVDHRLLDGEVVEDLLADEPVGRVVDERPVNQTLATRHGPTTEHLLRC